MPNAWTEHLHKWAKEHNESYMCALNNPKAREGYTPLKVAKKLAREEKRKAKLEAKPKGKVVKLNDEAAAKAMFKEELNRLTDVLKNEIIPLMANVEAISNTAEQQKWTQKKWSKAIDALGGTDSDIWAKSEDYKDFINGDASIFDYWAVVQHKFYKEWATNNKLITLYVKKEGFKDVNDYLKQKATTENDLTTAVSRRYLQPLLDKYDIDQFF
jgi:hypothetical protein